MQVHNPGFRNVMESLVFVPTGHGNTPYTPRRSWDMPDIRSRRLYGLSCVTEQYQRIQVLRSLASPSLKERRA